MADPDKTKSRLASRDAALAAPNAPDVGELCQRLEALSAEQLRLKQEVAQWDQLFDSLPDALTILDADFRIVRINSASARSLPSSRMADILGKHCYELFHGRESPCPDCPSLEATETGQPAVRNAFETTDGWRYKLLVCPLKDPQGHTVGTVQKVESRVQEKGTAAQGDSEGMYRAIVESMPAISYVASLDASSTTLYVSPQVKTILGYTQDDYCADTDLWRKLIHPEDKKRVLAEVSHCVASGEPFKTEYRMLSRDGRTVWFQDHAAIVRDACGRPMFLAGVMLDITGRKRAEKKLRRLSWFFEYLIDNANIWVSVADRDGKLIIWNTAAERITGYSLDATVGHDRVWSWLYPNKEYRDSVVRMAANTAEGRSPLKDFESVILTRDGQRRIISCYAKRFKDEKGEWERTIILARDVTEQKVAEDALRESEERLASFMDSATDAFYLFDSRLNLVLVNTSALKRLGLTNKKQAIGKSLAEVCQWHVPGVETAQVAQFQGVARTGKPAFWDVEGRDPSGNAVYLSIQAFSVGDGLGLIATDITARKKTDEELRRSQEWLSEFMVAATDGIILMDAELKVIDINPVNLKRWGLERKEQAIGKPINDFCACDRRGCDKCRWRMRLENVIRTGVPAFYEYDTPVPEGQHSFVSMRAFKVGGGLGMMITDITESKKMESALRQSEERYRGLVDVAPVAIGVAVEGKVAFLNREGLEMLRVPSLDHILGKPIIEFVHPEFRQSVGERFRMLFELRQGVPEREEKFLRFDGSPFDVAVAAVPVMYGDKPAVQVVFQDVTERKRAEAALRESEERYRMLADNASDLIWTTDLDLRVTYASPSVTKITGYTEQEARTLTVMDIFAPASLDKVRRQFLTDLQIERTPGRAQVPPRVLELEAVRKDGSRVWLETNSAFLRNDCGQPCGVMGVARDISERKRMQEQLSEVTAHVQRRIGQDLHDSLGQTLTGIACLSQVLAGKLSAMSLSEAVDASRIEQLLNQASEQTRRLARGLCPVQLESQGLMMALDDIAANTRDVFRVSCLFECPRPVALTDNTLATHLFYIAQEAVHNAIRHAKAKNIVIGLSRVDGRMELTITNDGLSLFSSVGEGGGLGLEIMRYRAATIGASLDIGTNEKGWTRVRCVLTRTIRQRRRRGNRERSE